VRSFVTSVSPLISSAPFAPRPQLRAVDGYSILGPGIRDDPCAGAARDSSVGGRNSAIRQPDFQRASAASRAELVTAPNQDLIDVREQVAGAAERRLMTRKTQEQTCRCRRSSSIATLRCLDVRVGALRLVGHEVDAN